MEPSPTAAIQNSSVTIETALTRIGYWKEAFTKYAKVGDMIPDTIPQAVFIPLPDIMALADKYTNKYGMKVAGVRAYFAIDQPFFEEKIRLLLVPVVEVTQDFVTTYRDLIIANEVLQPVTSIETSIYDFTKPCPDFCDHESLLYNAPPGKQQ